MNPSRIWWWTASTKFLHTTPGKPHTTVGHGPTHRVCASGKALWSGAGPWGWHGVHCWQPFYSTGIQPAPSWPPPCAVQVHPITSTAVEVRARAAFVLFRCIVTHNLQQRHANASTLAHGAHRPTLLSTSSCRVGLCPLYLFLPERLHGFLGPICCDEPDVWSEWCSVAAFGFHQQFVNRK